MSIESAFKMPNVRHSFVNDVTLRQAYQGHSPEAEIYEFYAQQVIVIVSHTMKYISPRFYLLSCAIFNQSKIKKLLLPQIYFITIIFHDFIVIMIY